MVTQKGRALYKRDWFVSIIVFGIVQLLFIMMERTGWIPRSRDFDGKLIGKIMEHRIFQEWFSFYETEWFNLTSVVLGVLVCLQLMWSLVKFFGLKVREE